LVQLSALTHTMILLQSKNHRANQATIKFD